MCIACAGPVIARTRRQRSMLSRRNARRRRKEAMVRNKPYRRCVISPAGQLFIKLLSHRPRLAFPSDVARTIWMMIDASNDAEAQAFKYQTTALIDRIRGRDDDAARVTVDAYFDQWLTPQ